MSKSNTSNPIASVPRLLAVMLTIAVGIATTGCSRAFWRHQADKDSYYMTRQKIQDPRWNVPRISIEPDPRSRFFHPYNESEPPLPPDDFAAHRFMHRVNGMKGYKNWHKFGRALAIENPHWLEPFGIRMKPGEFNDCEPIRPLPTLRNLTLVESIELSYIHSREYQTAIEDLYLTALALTLERFQFQVRYLGFSGEPGADLEFESIPDGQNSLSLQTNFGISQMLPAGGQFIVELVNNTVWLFTGENEMSTASVLSYSLVQPLLRGAGRDVVLESLTQAERNVLYSARDLSRFRKSFFTGVVNSFLGLQQQRQNIINQSGNIVQLEEQVELLRVLASQRPEDIRTQLDALPPGFQIPQSLEGQLRYDEEAQSLIWSGPMSEQQARDLADISDDPAFATAANDLIQQLRLETVTLDVAQLETQLASSRNNLRNAERAYQDQLDNYKIQLGLPPDMGMTLNESVLEQFELIDPRLTTVTEAVEDFVDISGRLNDEQTDQEFLRFVLRELDELTVRIREEGLELVQQDIDRVEALLESDAFASRADAVRERVRRDVDNDWRLFANVRSELERYFEQIEVLKSRVTASDMNQESMTAAVNELRDIREELLARAQSLQVIQINERVELISLQPFDMSLQEATSTALRSRLDLMNVRALTMDARRQVEVAANTLESVLNVRAEGDIRTPPLFSTMGDDDIFDFRGDLSSYRVGVSFTAPLDQVAERNAFRAALVNYQRARRDYIDFEDQVKFQVRQAWRQLDVLDQNFEIARQQIRIAALQLDQAVEEAGAPVAPGQSRTSGTQGLNFLNALQDVLNAQNSLIGIWVNYETGRLNIYRDMGIMEIDPSGIWYDDYYQQLAREQRAIYESRVHGTGSGEFSDHVDGRPLDSGEPTDGGNRAPAAPGVGPQGPQIAPPPREVPGADDGMASGSSGDWSARPAHAQRSVAPVPVWNAVQR